MNYRYHLLRLLSVLLLLCAGCDKKDATTRVSAAQVVNKTALLATITEEMPSQTVDPSLSMGLHAPQLPSFQPIFSKNGGGVAYHIENNDKVYVVHNGQAGKQYDAVGAITLSPDGSRIAYGALVAGKWRMVTDGQEGAAFSTVRSPLFSPDGKHLAYQAMSGEKWYLVVDTTQNAGTLTRFLDHQFSADSRKIAYIDNAEDNNRGRLVVSDLAFTRQTIVNSCAFRMVASQNGSHIAAIGVRDNKQNIVVCGFDQPDLVKTGPQYSAIHGLAFAPDGVTLAYTAERDGRHLMVFNDKEEAFPDGGRPVGDPVVRPDQNGVGVMITVNGRTFFHQCFVEGWKRENTYDEVDIPAYNPDGSAHAYAARRDNDWFVVVNGVEGKVFDRVVSSKFSPRGKSLVYRARKDGKRFVVVANSSGKIVRQHPAYEQVFDVVFTADGKSVAYGVKDGQKLVWRVEAL